MFHDSHDHPAYTITFARALAESSNVGMIRAGELVPARTMYGYLTAFGLGNRTGIGLPESRGLLPPADQWNASQRYTVLFGQGLAVTALQAALTFEEDPNSRYYLGLCQFMAGDLEGARATLGRVMDEPLLFRQGQAVGAYIMGQVAEGEGDADAARAWYARMAEAAPKVIPALEEEARRHKQTPYGETMKEQVRAMQRIIARRPLEGSG